MKRVLLFLLSANLLLCLGSCANDDDPLPMRQYEFSDNHMVVGKEAADIEVVVTNADELGYGWWISEVGVTDDIRTDSIIHNVQYPVYDAEGNFRYEGFSSALEWGWFKIRKANEGRSLQIHVDENRGGERSLSISMGLLMDHGNIYLTQEGTK